MTKLPRVDRDLVIRIVPPDVADRPDVVRSFDSTMRRIAALHHHAMVPVDDYWREPGSAYVVLRRMRGGTLQDRLDDGAMPLEQVADLARRIGSALGAAHEAGVVHGRVIPESVLFDESGRAHLSDFPLGEVDAAPGDDMASLAGVVHSAINGRGAATAHGSESTPRQQALADAVMSDDPPSLSELLDRVEQLVGAGPRAASPTNPYKGLRAFDEPDRADFFGREQLVAELVARLGESGTRGRLVLLVGASGSGKSSVVRAGLLPSLRAGAAPGSQAWLVTTMAPGADPFEELTESLGRVATASGPNSGLHGPVDPAVIRSGGLAAILPRILPDGSELLLVVDQLEELFTLADDDVQRAFLEQLVTALRADDSRLRVVATLRADFYDRPLRFRGFGELVRDATVTVPPMSAAQLEATIKGPADRVGLEVEPPLVAELVAAVVDQPAAMPSLQFTLYELAEDGQGRLDLAAYRRLGGVGGAIAARAEELYGSLDDGDDVVRHLFEQLVVIGPAEEPTRRPATIAELAQLVSNRPIDEVVQPWVAGRLLQRDRHPETREPTVEVAHEALLREWPRLRGWIDADRTAIVAAAELRDAARSWETLDRDPGSLYRGARLEAALQQLGGRIDTLPEPAGTFLDASVAARDQRRADDAARAAQQARTNRRLRRQLAALAIVTVIALVGGVITVDQRGSARAEQREAVARELAAEAVAALDEDPELSILLALEAVERTRSANGTALPAAESALHRALTAHRIVLSVPGAGGSLDWSPDGRVFVTVAPEDSGLVDVRDAATGERVLAFAGHATGINDVAFSADGTLLATSGDDGLLRVWHAATGRLQAEIDGRGPVWGVSFSPDGARVAAGWVHEGVVRTLDLAGAGPSGEFPARTLPLADSTSFSPDGERLAVADEAGVVVFDVESGERLLSFRTGTNPFTEEVLAVRWSPDGRWIASASRGLVTRVTDAATGRRHITLEGHTHDVYQLDWSADGTRLATGARDGTARVWEFTEGGAVETAVLTARDGAIGGVAFSPSGERLLTGDVRVTAARIWDVGIDGGAELLNLPTTRHVAGMAEFTPRGDALVATGVDGPLTVWDAATGESRRSFGADVNETWEVDVSPDGDLVATIGIDEPPRTRIWDRRSGQELFAVQDVGFFPERVAWSPDGELLAVAGFQSSAPAGKVVIVDRTGAPITELVEDVAHAPRYVEFGPDGDWLITQRRRLDVDDPTLDGVRVWDWARGQVLTDLPVLADVIAVDPTGERVAVGEVAAGGSVWDIGTGERLASLNGHSGDIAGITFSPDGATVATAGADGTVRLWAAETGTEQLVLPGEDGPVSSVAFGPEGDRLASVSVGLIRVWALDLDDLVDIAERRVTRSLTDAECRRYLRGDACLD